MPNTPEIATRKMKSKWPTVSKRLVEQLEKWVMRNVPTYKPGDTGDQALGVLAYHAGMRHVVASLKQVQATQEKRANIQAIHTTTQE